MRTRGARRALVAPGFAAFLGALLLAATAPAADGAFVAGVFEPPHAAPELVLQGSDGAELRLERFRGKVVILGFGYTSCTDVCPITLSTLASARRKLGARAEEVQVVYVTVDPERDDAERMRAYLRSFDPTFVGGTGTEEQLAAVRKSYGAVAEQTTPRPHAGFSHSSYTYLIDREGRLRALMPYGHSADDYVHDLAILLGP